MTAINSGRFIFLTIFNFVLAIHRDLPRPVVYSGVEEINTFLVGIHFYFDSELRYFCGGSIISRDYFLTSADCLNYGKDRPLHQFRQIRIVAGSKDLQAGGSLYLLDSEFYPKGYKDDSVSNNIALVRIKPSFHLGSNIKIVPIRLREFPTLGNPDIYFAGWGSVKEDNEGGHYPETLLGIELEIISNQECQYYHDKLSGNEICTKSYIGQGLCRRDEGGPLIIKNPGNNEIFAVATNRYSCGNGFPDVYIKIAPFIQWINETCKCI